MSKNKEELVDLMARMQKQFGKGSVTNLRGSEVQDIEVIPTGSLSLNKAMGIGGWPRGRMSEIYGAPSCGKSTLMLHAVEECQRAGGVAAYIDVEFTLDPKYARNIGVDLDNLIFSQPDSAEQALEIVDELCRSGHVDLIVVDSVAALVPTAEAEGEMGDNTVGLQARLMGKAMRKLTSSVSRSNTAVIFVNQTRMKIGVSYGDPTTTSGGNALPFYASMRVKLSRTGSVKQGDEVVANETRAQIVKNKLAPPYTEAEFEIEFGVGISKFGEVIDFGVEYGIVQKSGAWFNYGDKRLGQGKENAKATLEADPELYQEILAKVMEKM